MKYAKLKKIKCLKCVKISSICFFILIIAALYFLMPYILQLLGVQSFVVITNSLEHYSKNQAFFDSVWRSNGFDPAELPYNKGINIGDLIIIRSSKNYSIGDIIVFRTLVERGIKTHRLYKYNQTHFRDLADGCLKEEKNHTVWVVAKGEAVSSTDDPKSVTDADEIYQGPAYELCTHYWMPVSAIDGKVILVLPKAGLFHLLLNPFDPRELQKVDDFVI
jgi:hypothetical protein